MLPPIAAVVLGLLFIERGLEIWINRRNTRELYRRNAKWLGPDGFGFILLSQIVLFGGILVELAFAPWGGETPWMWGAIVVLILAQLLRYWCITTLGWRWSIRVVTVPGAPRIVSGPYRWFPHPNYVAVMLEAIALPLAFGAYATLLVAAPLQLAALWRRVKIEERALRSNPVPS